MNLVHASPSQFNITLHPCLGLPIGFFPQVSITKPCMRLFSPPHVLHSQPISLFFVISVQIIKFFNMGSSPATCYLELLRLKYLPQHPILENPEPTLLNYPSHMKCKFYRTWTKLPFRKLNSRQRDHRTQPSLISYIIMHSTDLKL